MFLFICLTWLVKRQGVLFSMPVTTTLCPLLRWWPQPKKMHAPLEFFWLKKRVNKKIKYIYTYNINYIVCTDNNSLGKKGTEWWCTQDTLFFFILKKIHAYIEYAHLFDLSGKREKKICRTYSVFFINKIPPWRSVKWGCSLINIVIGLLISSIKMLFVISFFI